MAARGIQTGSEISVLKQPPRGVQARMNNFFELPLFPLNLVLLPKRSIPLHIFEERYQEMISCCIEGKTEFGIVSGEDNSFQDIGCSALVDTVVDRFPDGRMNIIISGRRRIKIIERLDIHSYISAVAEELPDQPEIIDQDLVSKVRSLYEEAVRLSLGWPVPQRDETTEPGDLSYLVAARLNLPLPEQQMLLEMRSAGARLRKVAGILEKAVAGVREVKRRTGRNGHLA